MAQTLLQSQFIFQAMTPTGARTLGVRLARDEPQLAQELQLEKQLLLVWAWKVPGSSAPPPGFPLKDEAALNEQLATLLSRGVPLVEALEVAQMVVTPASRPRVAKLREMVSQGSSFSRACESLGGFDTVTVSVYRTAERTGDLAGAAQRLAHSARRRLSLAGKAVTLMIYPSIVCIVSMAIFFCLLAFVVPMIAKQIRAMNAPLPGFSRAVFSVGEWVNANLSITAGVIVAAIVLAVVFNKALIAAAARLIRVLPVVSGLALSMESARFFSAMGAMSRSGVPLADALGISTGVISNPRLRGELDALRRGLVEGGVLRVLVEKVETLPLATRKLLVAADRAGDLGSAFESLANDVSDEVDRRAARLLALLEPLLLLALFGLIGPLLIAIAVPLMTFRTAQ